MSLLNIIKEMRDEAVNAKEMQEVFRYIWTVYPSTVPIDVCAVMANDMSAEKLKRFAESGRFPAIVSEGENGRKSYTVFTMKWLEFIGVKDIVFQGGG